MVLGISPLLSGLRLGEPNTSTAQAESQTKGSLFYMDANDMKLSDYLTGVGRPISYFPKLRRITGSTNATIFLCQLVYWTGKGSNPDGWIYKTSDEFEDETGLSYDEQKTARKKLIEAGLMEERYARLEHQMYFRVLVNAMNDKWGTPQDDIPEHGNTALGKADSPCSFNSNTENTTETTTKNTSSKKSKSKTSIKGIESAIYQGREVTEEDIKVSSRENEIEGILTRLDRGLNINCPRTPEWQSLARWIIKQEQELEDWVDWFMGDEFRAKTVSYLTPNKIKMSWPQAEGSAGPEPIQPFAPLVAMMERNRKEKQNA